MKFNKFNVPSGRVSGHKISHMSEILKKSMLLVQYSNYFTVMIQFIRVAIMDNHVEHLDQFR